MVSHIKITRYPDTDLHYIIIVAYYPYFLQLLTKFLNWDCDAVTANRARELSISTDVHSDEFEFGSITLPIIARTTDVATTRALNE